MPMRVTLDRVFVAVGIAVLLGAVHLSAVPLLAEPARGEAPAVELPKDSGYVDIRTRYGARGDGETDDTAAFQQAIDDDARHLYLPPGTYLLSETIRLESERWTVQGAGQHLTTLKLRDRTAGYDQPGQPRPLVAIGGGSGNAPAAAATARRVALFDLAIDVGGGNAGAIGLHAAGGASLTLCRVTIRSSDDNQRGKAGLALASRAAGATWVEDVTIAGFDLGLWVIQCPPGVVCERLALRQQRECGIDNTGQLLTIRRLVSTNRVPALRSRGSGAMVTLLDSECRGGAGGKAVESAQDGALHVRNLRTAGYQAAVECRLRGKTMQFLGPDVSEFVSHPPLNVFDTTATVKLPIEEPPYRLLPPAGDWTSVATFGARAELSDADMIDSGPAIQRAIDAGAETIYFPRGRYTIRTPVVVRGKAARFIGCESMLRLLTGDQPAWTIANGEAPAVTFERFETDARSTTTQTFEHASTRILVLRHSTCGGYWNSVAGGKLFVIDVCGGPWSFDGQQVWARQLSTGVNGGACLRSVGSNVWLLGPAATSGSSALAARGGRVELFGGCFRLGGQDAGAPAVDLLDCRFSGGWVNLSGDTYHPQVREQMLARSGELLLFVDPNDREPSALVYRLTRDGKVLEESIERDKKLTAEGIYRRGAQGVRVPIFQGGTPQ